MKKSLFLGLVLLLIVSLMACGSKPATQPAPQQNQQTTDNQTTTDKKPDPITVNIGYSGPLSGPAAFYGENTLSGLTMAVDEMNESGGFKINGQPYILNLVALDDRYLPNETGTNARRLVQENNTPIIFSPHSGGIFAMQVFNEQDNFLIAAYTSEPKVTSAGNQLTMRIPPMYTVYTEPFSNYVMERFGNKIALLPTATQYGKDWTEVLKSGWTSLGGEIVFDGSIDFSKDTDFFTIVTNALDSKPDVLFVGGPSEPTALVMNQARELGFQGGFVVMDQAKFDEMAAVFDGDYSIFEGSVGVLPLILSKYPGTPQFIEKYNALYNKNPGSEAGYHYVSMYILVEAMKAAGTATDPKAIRDNIQAALDNLPDDKKVYEIERVEEDGGFSTVLRMATIENGEVVELVVE